jgi:cardiolipin synthase
LKAGVKIVEYRKTHLHGKVAVIDDRWATVGSSNCDGFSLFLNQEANVVVLDPAFAEKLRAHIARGVADGVAMNWEEYENIPLYKRIFYRIAYFIYKNMMRVMTWGKSNE